MSISENSTLLANNRENEGSYQLLDDRYNNGPAVNAYDKSPYTDPDFVTLDVGPNHTIFRLHRIVLSQSPELEVKPFSKLWGDKASESIALPELDESTAHTLVHYLYSGLYQTLYSHDPSIKGGSLAAYKLGTCVYVASVRYRLPGLADLSKEQINVSSEDLSILDILSVAREHAFPNLPVDEQWYPENLEAAIHAAFTKDPGFFTTGEFADQLEGGRRFRQVVMKAVVGTLSKRPSAGAEVEVISPPEEIVEEQEPEMPESEMPEPEMEVPEPEPEPEPEPALPEPEIELVSSYAAIVDEDGGLVLDAIEPTPSPPLEPEPFTDEVGFGTSQTYRRFSRTNSSAEPSPTHLDDEKVAAAKRPAHERVDSLLQGVESISSQPSEESIVEAQVPEKDEIVVAMPDNTVSIAPEVTPEVPANDTPLSSTAKRDKKKKKKQKKAAAAAAAAAALSEIPVVDGAVEA